MALQLGLDGRSIKLLDGHPDSLREVLSLTAPRYREYTQAIDVGESDRAVYWRIVFALLSVHSPIDATFEAYRTLRVWNVRHGRTGSRQTIERLLRASHGNDGVIQYIPTKSHYLREFDLAWRRDKTAFTRNGDCDDAWRQRLRAGVLGLGMAKSTFAVCLIAPTIADVCCIDTHMFHIFAGRPAGKAIGKRSYLAMEQKVRELAREFNLSTFAAQWALWDARRGTSNPHSVLTTA